MKKGHVLFAIFVIVSLALVACGAGGPSAPAEPVPDQPQNEVILDELTVEEVQQLIGAPEPVNDVDIADTEIYLPGEVNLVTTGGTYSVCRLEFDTVKNAHSVGFSCAGVRVDLGTIMPIVAMNFVAQGTMSTVLVPDGLIALGSTVNIVQKSTGVLLMATVATGITAATSTTIQTAPCVTRENYDMYLLATDPSAPKPRMCADKALFEELPQACKDHHAKHDDSPENPDAQARWKTASDASKLNSWGPATSSWSNQQTEKGQWRCSQTEVNINGNWKVIRFATSNATKITPTNAYGDMTIVDVFNNQITSFPNARWHDLIKSANDLITNYGAGNVRTYPINCYDLQQYGVVIKSSLNGDQSTRSNQAAVCTQP